MVDARRVAFRGLIVGGAGGALGPSLCRGPAHRYSSAGLRYAEAEAFASEQSPDVVLGKQTISGFLYPPTLMAIQR